MPRPPNGVKFKTGALSPGATDIHFHGAFGVDLVRAQASELEELSQKLAQGGVAAFAPTLLSLNPTELAQAVSRLGAWTRSRWAAKPGKIAGAFPLGLHLEGPYLDAQACGAHPPELLRDVDLDELERLWELSHHTLKILTLSPLRLRGPAQLKTLTQWAAKRRIRLSLGHSRASREEALAAFKAGFGAITHAWNAMPFHHREPGILAAAYDSPQKPAIELIPDGIHVHDSVVRLTVDLFGAKRVQLISDCVPAAQTDGGTAPFGPLKIREQGGACWILEGPAANHLAGGAQLLPQSFTRWCSAQADGQTHWKAWLPALTQTPWQTLPWNKTELARVRREISRLRLRWAWRGSLRYEVVGP